MKISISEKTRLSIIQTLTGAAILTVSLYFKSIILLGIGIIIAGIGANSIYRTITGKS